MLVLDATTFVFATVFQQQNCGTNLFFFSVYGLESWQQTKVLRWGYVASHKELGNRSGEEEGIIKDTVRLFHAGASEMLLPKLEPSHGWAGRPPEFRNRPWISQKDPGLSQKN